MSPFLRANVSARFKLLGVTVTPANSWWEAGSSVTRKILRLFWEEEDDGRLPPVAESTLSFPNAFPLEWRLLSSQINLLPQLNRSKATGEFLTESGEPLTGQALLAKTLLDAEEKVTVIVTGPLTNLAWVLDNFPEAEPKIDRVLIMGEETKGPIYQFVEERIGFQRGALDVPGNVEMPGHDGSAEWNFYCDPRAAKRVWDSNLAIVLTALDSTRSAPITRAMILRLGQQGSSERSDIIGTMWAMAAGAFFASGNQFFSWDLITVVHLVKPEFFKTSEVMCDVVREGQSQGRTVREGLVGEAGRARSVTLLEVADPRGMYDAVLEELSKP